MQDHNFNELRETLGAQQGEGFEEKLQSLMLQNGGRALGKERLLREYQEMLEPKYVIVCHDGHYSFRAGYTDMHRSLLSDYDFKHRLCDGGGFWGVDGENKRVTLYDSSSDFGRPKHIEEAIRWDGERLLELLGQIGDKEGNKYDLTGYDVTYMDAIGHRHTVVPMSEEEREETMLRERMGYNELRKMARQYTTYRTSRPSNKHPRIEAKDARKKTKAKRRQQKQARRKH